MNTLMMVIGQMLTTGQVKTVVMKPIMSLVSTAIYGLKKQTVMFGHKNLDFLRMNHQEFLTIPRLGYWVLMLAV